MIKPWLLSLLALSILCSPYVHANHGGTQPKRVMLSKEQQASTFSSLALRRLHDDVLDDADTNDEDPQAQLDVDKQQTVTTADTPGLNGDNDEDLGTDDFDIPGDQDNAADVDNVADGQVQTENVNTINTNVVDNDDADNDPDNNDNTDDNVDNDLDEDEMELQAKEAAAAAGNGGRDGEGDDNGVDPDNLDDPYEDFGNPDDNPEGIKPGRNSTTDVQTTTEQPADVQQPATVDKDITTDTDTDEHLKAALDADDEDDETNNSDQIRNNTLVLPNGNSGSSANGTDAQDDWDTEVVEELPPIHRTIPDEKVNGSSTVNTTASDVIPSTNTTDSKLVISNNTTQPVTLAANTTSTTENQDSADKLQPVANNDNDGDDADNKNLDDDAAKWQDVDDQDDEQQGPNDNQPTDNQSKPGEGVDGGQQNDDNDNTDDDVNGDQDPQADVVDTEDEGGQGQKVVVEDPDQDGDGEPGDGGDKVNDNTDKDTAGGQPADGDDVLDNDNDDVDDPNNVDNGPADQDVDNADVNDDKDPDNDVPGNGKENVDNDQQQQPATQKEPDQEDQQGKNGGLDTGRADDDKDKDDDDALIEDDDDKASELVTDSVGSGSENKDSTSGQGSGKSASMFSTVTAAAGLSFKWAMKDEVILYTGSIAFLALLLAGFAIGKKAFSKVKSLKRSSDGYLPISNTDKVKDAAMARQGSSRVGSPKIVWDDWNDNDAGAWDAAENGKGRGGAEHFAAPARYRTTAHGSNGGALHSIGSGAVDLGALSPRVSLIQTRPSMPGSPTHASSAVRPPGSPHRAATTDGRTARVARSEKKSTLGAVKKQKQKQPQTDSSDSR